MTVSIISNDPKGSLPLNDRAPDSVRDTGASFQDRALISRDKVLSINSEAQKAAKAMLATLSAKSGPLADEQVKNSNAPELRAPAQASAEESNFTGNARFLQLLGAARDLLGTVSLSQLSERLQVALANRAALSATNSALSKEFDEALKLNQQALDRATADMGSLQNAQDQLTDKQRAVDAAKAALAAVPEGDEAAYAQAQRNLATAENELAGAKLLVNDAQTQANASYQIAKESMLKVEQLLSVIQGTVRQSASAVTPEEKQSLDSLTRMFQLISAFIQLVGKNSEQALEKDAELFQRMQQNRQAEMRQKSDDYTAEVRKAEELNKTMGCVGKVLGGLIMAVSIVGAVFTGGASLALAAVGVALMVADEVGKAITGVSFMEKALSPLMDGIIKPLVDMISQAVTGMLKSMGVDENTAAMIGGIVGALVAVALIVAVVVVGKAGAGKLASSAMGRMVGEAVKKMVPNAMKNMATKSSAVVSDNVKRMLDRLSVRSDRASLDSYANTLQRTNNATILAAQGVQAGGGVMQGIYEKRAHDMIAAFTLSASVMDQLRQMLADIGDKFTDTQKFINHQWSGLIEAQTNAMQTNQAILRNTSA